MNGRTIRIVLADDHTIFREGVRCILEKVEGMKVVGEAEDGNEALKLVEKLSPDVIVMDLDMPRMNGFTATKRILAQTKRTHVIVLSESGEAEHVVRMLGAGAMSYYTKTCTGSDLVKAIQEASVGRSTFPPAIASIVRERVRTGPNGFQGGEINLTVREWEVLQLIAEGHPNKSISDLLAISTKTVEKHRQSLMNKLRIHHIAGLTRYAIETGFKLHTASRLTEEIIMPEFTQVGN